MDKNPCYQCPDRVSECHSTCTRYKEWKSKYDEYKSIINKSKERTNYYDYYKAALVRKTKKKR